MKKGSGTKRVLVVALTIAMLLQNSAVVLATDGTAAASETSQEQSTELQSAAPEQMDAESDQQETKVSETPSPKTTTQAETPQADTPKIETPETDALQTDTPQTSAPETQETPGLTLPDGETDNRTSNGENDNGDTYENGSTTEVDSSVVHVGDYAKSGDENIEDANDGIMPIDISYMNNVAFDANGGTWEAAPTLKVNINGTNETEIALEATNPGKTKYNVPTEIAKTFQTGGATTIWKPDPAPTQAGKRFLYWKKIDIGEKDFYGGKDSVALDVGSSCTLYAVWAEPTCKITYELCGGEWPEGFELKETFAPGEDFEIGKLAVPQKKSDPALKKGEKSYNFGGWYLDKGLTQPITNTNQLEIPRDITVYAKWDAVGRVRYWLKDNPRTGTDWAVDLQTEGETTVHKSKRDEFAGPYYIDSISNYCDNEKKKIGSTEDLYPLYGTDRVNVPKAIPTRDGYTFKGWNQSKSTGIISAEKVAKGFEDKFYYDGGWSDGTGDYASEVVPDYQTYNAEWDENDVTISYHAKENGKIVITSASAAGEGSESETETFKDVTEEAAGATAIPDEGYHFTEWKVVKRASDGKENVQVSKDAVLNSGKVAENATRARKGEGSVKYTPVYYATTFEAYFAPNTYKVKFDKNSSDATGNMADQTYTFGKTQNLTANTFTRLHYKFAGWALVPDATEATYEDMAPFVINEENIASLKVGADNTVTLYAVWKETASATITYVLNGRNEAGKIQTVNPSGNKESYRPGEDSFAFEEPTYKVIPTDGSAEKKYVFEGWYTDRTFKADTKKTGITLDDRGNITVYAKWRAAGRVRYYLDTQDANWNLEADSDRIIPETPGNRKNFIDVTDNYTDGSDDTLTGVRSFTVPLNAPTRTGYRFDGWKHSEIKG